MKVYVVLLIVSGACLMSGCGQTEPRPREAGARPEQLRQPAPPGAEKAPLKQDEAPERKIVYTATVLLVTEDFTAAAKGLGQLVKDQGGYVINSDVSGSSGSPRSGQWKIRLPVEKFDAFQQEVAKLGELQKNSVDSQDVTDEYYDLQARLTNKKVQEQRLLQHLDKSTAKLDDILAVEREISRVREEVERHQGRINLLKKLSEMTTITVIIQERGAYVPPEAPTFPTTVGRTFHASWDGLVALGKGLVLFVVALAPWAVLLGLVGVPGLILMRRHLHKPPPLVVTEAVKPPPPQKPAS